MKGIYETILCENGKIQYFDNHFHRLKNSAQKLKLVFNFSKKDLLQEIYEKLSESKENKIRIRINLTDNIEIIVAPVNESTSTTLVTFQGERQYPEFKNTDRTIEDQALTFAHSKGAIDAILIDQNGNLTEGAISNFFIVKNGKIITPNQNILPGIMREQILKHADKLNIPVLFKNIQLQDIPSTDEIFISNSIKQIVPIFQIDNYILNKSNPITQLILDSINYYN